MILNNVVLGLLIVLWAVVVGLMVVAFGQILLAVREIALNTRREEAKHHQGHYSILLVMAKVNNVLGWILLAAGVAIGIYVAVAGVPAFLSIPTLSVGTEYLRP
jgi:hypothetical protein